MGLIRTSDPSVEPVSLAEAKLHLSLDSSDSDSLVTSLITAARIRVEEETRRSLITQTWKLKLDCFPTSPELPQPFYERAVEHSYFGYRRGAIYLERPPLSSVTSIKYVDDSGVTQTLSSALYQVESVTSVDPRIVPAYQQSWPSTRDQIEAVEVIYQAGYGATGASVPLPIRQAILLLVGAWFKSREDTTDKALALLPRGVEWLLAPYSVKRLV